MAYFDISHDDHDEAAATLRDPIPTGRMRWMTLLGETEPTLQCEWKSRDGLESRIWVDVPSFTELKE